MLSEIDIENYKYKIEIDTNSSLFPMILRYAATFDSINHYITDGIDKEYGQNNKEFSNIEYKVDLKIGYGIHKILFNNNEIIINYYRQDDKPVGTSYCAKLMEYLILYSNNSKEDLTNFILESRINSEPKKNENIVCKILKNVNWITLSKLPKRDSSSIFLDENIKEDIFYDIDNFLENENEYIKYGIPYKRNYLLEGSPGTGKTSLIFTIASKYNMDIAIINFGPKVDDNVFMTAISNLPANSILILEDIDALFIERSSSTENHSMISFSGVLNVLDGMARKHKMITFMTTNYIDKLDNALKRPGRIDYTISFNSATEKQIIEMFSHFLPNIKIPSKIIENIIKKKITTAMLQKFLFENRNSKDIFLDIDKLYKLSNKTKNLSIYI